MNAPIGFHRRKTRFGATNEDPQGSGPAAFTFLELLVVLAVVALGTMLLVPALARTQPDSRAARCLNNHRQLCRAWLMYASDNNDNLATSMQGSAASLPTQPMWAPGWLDWTASRDNTNTIYLTDPRYSIPANYCGKDARLFKCPADQYVSATQLARGWKQRVRSISSDGFAANGNIETGPLDPAYNHVTKLTALLNPKPGETWVSIDEHPDSINDGVLLPPNATQWFDEPANYHDGGAGVAFADGRAEIRRWQAVLLSIPVSKFTMAAPISTANDLDIQWLRYHTPRKPGAN